MSNNFFMIGDLVAYTGDRFKSELGGAMGEVCAPVQNDSNTYVINFGKEDYVMPARVLTRFQGHARPASEDKPATDKKDKKSKGGPQVSRRRGKQEEPETE